MFRKPVWLKAIQQFLRNGKVPEGNAKATEKNRTATRIQNATQCSCIASDITFLSYSLIQEFFGIDIHVVGTAAIFPTKVLQSQLLLLKSIHHFEASLLILFCSVLSLLNFFKIFLFYLNSFQNTQVEINSDVLGQGKNAPALKISDQDSKPVGIPYPGSSTIWMIKKDTV